MKPSYEGWAGMRRAPDALCYLIVAIIVLGQGFCVGFGPPTLTSRDLDRMPLWPHQVRELHGLQPPAVPATAALLLDVATRTPLYQKDAERRMAPASTTKMMTALIAIERGRLDDAVVVQAADLPIFSFAGLGAGEVWTLEDLLYALLLPSDNTAALVIARHIAGSEAAFVELMNAQAARWGLKNTHFANPHGLDDPAHYSCAADLAQIALHGLENPTFTRIVKTREHKVGNRTLVSLNQLLGSYEGAEGIKTGTTDEAGQCLVSLAVRPSGRAVCVVLGSTDRYRDSGLLLDYYFAGYRLVALDLGPRGLNRIRRPDGTEAVLVLREHQQVLVPRWQMPWLRVQRLWPASGEAGDPATGTVRFTLRRAVLAEMPIYATAP